MKEVINYMTQGTCCRMMNVAVEGDKIVDIEFIGGCNGNLQGIRKLVIGLSINEVITKLRGIRCGDKDTSCPDQLAVCLEKFLLEKYPEATGVIKP